MRYTGLNYILNNFNFNINEVLVGFDFQENQSISNTVLPNFWSVNSASGILNNIGQFYNYSGTGYFNGNSLMELNKPLVLGSNSTLIFSYEKLRSGHEILISSITGNSFNTYSGFCIGINDANKLYFKYWNPVEGPFTLTYNKVLANKNLMVINKNGPVLNIGRFNNNNYSFEIEHFQIKNNAFRESNKIYIGGNNINTEWCSGNSFSGFIDQLYLINNIPIFYNEELALGLFSNVGGGELQTENICIETGYWIESGYEYFGPTGVGLEEVLTIEFKITGYETVIIQTGYFGETGSEKIILGTGIDNCGIEKELFYINPLSGFINQEYTIQNPLSGNVETITYNQIELSGLISGVTGYWFTEEECFQNIIEIEDSFDLNTNYLKSLSFSEISLLKEVNFSKNDIIEIFTETYKSSQLFYNKDVIFDRINLNYVLPENLENILLFGNGQALVDSGFNFVQDGYNILIIPNVDYIITGNRVETNNFFGEEDYLFYDSFSGRKWEFKITGNILNLPIEINNYWIFKNGQKLVEGNDYSELLFSSSIVLNTDNQTGENYYIIKEIPNNFIYYSGNYGSLKLTGDFNNDCSQVYFNGIKQKINNNYIENSNFDFLSGIFYENSNNFTIYNNTEDFFV